MAHGKESICNAGDLNSIPGLGRSPGEGKGYPLQCSGLENSMDCIVHRVTKCLSDMNERLSLSLCISHVYTCHMFEKMIPRPYDKIINYWPIVSNKRRFRRFSDSSSESDDQNVAHLKELVTTRGKRHVSLLYLVGQFASQLCGQTGDRVDVFHSMGNSKNCLWEASDFIPWNTGEQLWQMSRGFLSQQVLTYFHYFRRIYGRSSSPGKGLWSSEIVWRVIRDNF